MIGIEIETVDELKAELESITHKILAAYEWKAKKPVERFIDRDDIIRDFTNIMDRIEI